MLTNAHKQGEFFALASYKNLESKLQLRLADMYTIATVLATGNVKMKRVQACLVTKLKCVCRPSNGGNSRALKA